jgi:integrase
MCSLLFSRLEPPKTVQTLLGHRSVAITLDIDNHISLELKKRAALPLHAALPGGQ